MHETTEENQQIIKREQENPTSNNLITRPIATQQDHRDRFEEASAIHGTPEDLRDL